MVSEKKKQVEEDFISSYYDLPTEKEREKLSIVELAELISKTEKDSVANIVLTHEIHMKIARKEAILNLKGVWVAGGCTIVGAIIGALLAR